ncbi:MAG: hypothetical protein H6685_11530 [Deltaproteobacteria bacterium]|nr:hypothetical protein [Deltaproteobacteria bacterium]
MEYGPAAGLLLLLFIALVPSFALADAPAEPTLLYAVGDTGAPGESSPLLIYAVVGDRLVWLDRVDIEATSETGFPSALTTDSDGGRLFVAERDSSAVRIFDTSDLAPLGVLETGLPGDVGGLDVDGTAMRLYVGDGTGPLVAAFDLPTLEAVPKFDLEPDVDTGVLDVFTYAAIAYVADGQASVRYYAESGGEMLGSYDLIDTAATLYVGELEGLTAFSTSGGLTPQVSRYTFADDYLWTLAYSGDRTVRGLAVNPAAGVVYVSVGGGDTAPGVRTLEALGETPEIGRNDVPDENWSPGDLTVGGGDYHRAASVTTSLDDARVPGGESVTVTLSVTNDEAATWTTLPAATHYDPTRLALASADVAPTATEDGVLIWDDLTATLGDIEVGETATVTLTFTTVEPEDCVGPSRAVVAAVFDPIGESETPAARRGASATFRVPCPCESERDCLDSRFCVGAGSCDAGVCEYAGNPCDYGVECVEEADRCGPEEDEDEDEPAVDDTADEDEDHGGDECCGCAE